MTVPVGRRRPTGTVMAFSSKDRLRANVRYYEKEGLLHPQRGNNNYRIYTDEDIEALKKIRLLRQLDMPIETIRAGEVPLIDAVARLDYGLWVDEDGYELARQTMAFIGTSGSGYQMSQSVLWQKLSQSDQWDGSPVSGNGFTRTAALEQEGYDLNFGYTAGMLAPKTDAESGWYRFTVRVERTAK